MESGNALVDLNSTEWWKQNRHRVLTGARLKVNLTQEQLPERTGFSVEFVKDCEANTDVICKDVAVVFAKALDTYPEKFLTNSPTHN